MFTEFLYFLEVSCCLELEDFVSMFMSFLSSMAGPNSSREDEVRFSQISLT